MDSYAVQNKHISHAARCDLTLATEFFRHMTEKPDGAYWSCHVLCRAFLRQGPICQWQAQDGYFHKIGNRHSWLWAEIANDVVILDVYPIAGVRPHLIAETHSPWIGLYIESTRSYGSEEKRSWNSDSNLVAEAMGKNAEWQKFLREGGRLQPA